MALLIRKKTSSTVTRLVSYAPRVQVHSRASPWVGQSKKFPVSNRGVSGDASHAVEVRVVAGKLRQSVFLHHCQHQCVIRQEPVLLAEGGGGFDMSCNNWKNLDADGRYRFNGLTKPRKLLDFVR